MKHLTENNTGVNNGHKQGCDSENFRVQISNQNNKRSLEIFVLPYRFS